MICQIHMGCRYNLQYYCICLYNTRIPQPTNVHGHVITGTVLFKSASSTRNIYCAGEVLKHKQMYWKPLKCLHHHISMSFRWPTFLDMYPVQETVYLRGRGLKHCLCTGNHWNVCTTSISMSFQGPTFLDIVYWPGFQNSTFVPRNSVKRACHSGDHNPVSVCYQTHTVMQRIWFFVLVLNIIFKAGSLRDIFSQMLLYCTVTARSELLFKTTFSRSYKEPPSNLLTVQIF